MNRLSLSFVLCLTPVSMYGRGQVLSPQQGKNLIAAAGPDLTSSIRTMSTAYAGSGSIVVLDSHTIVIEPKMPAPLCAVPKDAGGKTTWSYYAFPLASITVPLAIVDDKLIGEDSAFTNPDAVKAYKPGQVGETTMVIITGLPGKQFHTLAYDRDKFLQLGPGPHSASDYGQAPDDTAAFALTFADRTAARAFAAALRKAVVLARAQVAQR
jgi:hypothetical protein